MPKPAKAAPAPAPSEFSPGPLMDFVGYRIRLAQLVVFDDFMRQQSDPVITPGQFAILIFIKENPGMTQQLLSRQLGIDKSTMTLALDRLTDRGLIVRVRSIEDRRRNALRLTAAGETRLRTMMSFVRRHERRITRHLSELERRQLMRLLSKIRPARRGSD